LVEFLSLFSFLITCGSLLYDFFGFAAIGSSFDGVIAVLVYTVINNLGSLSVALSSHQDYLQQSQRTENTLFKLCNMAAMLFL